MPKNSGYQRELIFMKKAMILISIFLFYLSACNLNAKDSQFKSTPSPVTTPEPSNTVAPTLIPSTPTASPSPTPILVNQVCSPLQDETLAELSEIITQPFKMPPLGFDNDHQGVDFSYYRHNGHIGIQGLPVFASLEGMVIAVLKEKMVYGNSIIIETPYDQIPAAWLIQLQLPAVAPTVVPNQRLTCPVYKNDPNQKLDINKRSLYLLYAHFDQPPVLKIGDRVQCGQQIGAVGNSGKSSNPHLHVEIRIGPSGAIFEGLAHYDARSTDMERNNYCVWRVSNLFQMIDPMRLFNLHF
jgi:murein DD-endopeptidase MepM/ murein hydrolase activator NlpD